MNWIRRKTRELKRQIHLMILLWKHAETPRLAKAVATCSLTYVFSPIQLIPSFIPVIGWVDDAAVLAVGLWLMRRLVPAEVLEDCKNQIKKN